MNLAIFFFRLLFFSVLFSLTKVSERERGKGSKKNLYVVRDSIEESELAE